MNHTKAPWFAKGETVWNEDEVMYIAADNFDTINPSQVLEANARLIAAAPSMYAFLRRIHEQRTFTPDDWDAVATLIKRID